MISDIAYRITRFGVVSVVSCMDSMHGFVAQAHGHCEREAGDRVL